MILVMSSSVPPKQDKSTTIKNVKRIKRNMESKRLEHIKKIQDTVKSVAKDEIEYAKSLLPKELFDEDDEY